MLVNGKQCDLISIRDRGLLYGDGVFRTLRVSGALVPQWPLHYQKLQHDCTVLGIACPEFSLLTAELAGLIQTHPGGVVKLIVTRGPGVRGYAPPFDPRPTHIWDIAALPDYPADWESHGIRARLCKMRLGNQPRLAGIKHLNRLENVLARAEWDDPAIFEGLLCDDRGVVVGGVTSNLFWVSHGELFTPDLSACGVAGVARTRLLRAAGRRGMRTHIDRFPPAAILAADEVMICNSVIGLRRVARLDDQTWPAAGWTETLKTALYENVD